MSIKANLPTGSVTFLFTDIEGSTKLAQQYPDLMPALLARHNHILHQAIEEYIGYVFHALGDFLLRPSILLMTRCMPR